MLYHALEYDIIYAFEAGLLVDVENGTAVRSFLALRLRCSDMRISKKFAGDNCLGNRVYWRLPYTAAQFEAEAHELAALEAAFVASVAAANLPAVAETETPQPGLDQAPASSATATCDSVSSLATLTRRAMTM